jgi:hypothetical protein
MAAGDVTQGHRRPDGTDPHALKPGEYALAGPAARVVWLCSPAGQAGHVSSDRWAITVEADDTVTVGPSIWWDKPTGWHGYLERGVWREV